MRLVTVAGIATAWRATPSRAMEVDFRPSMAFGAAHDGNVRIVDYDPTTQQSVSKQGDDYARVDLLLGWDWKTRTSTISFTYHPEYVKYRNRSELDFFGNTLLFGYSRQTSPRTKTTVDVDVTRTDTQGVNSVNVGRPNTFVPRTTLTAVYLDSGGAIAVGARAFVDWRARASADRHKEVDNIVFQDTSELGVMGGWRYALSERSTLGLAVDLDGFDYSPVPPGTTASTLPSVFVETVGLSGTYAANRQTGLSYTVGASHSTWGTTSTESGGSTTNGSFSLAIAREIAEVSHLAAGISQGVAPGSGAAGATLDTGAWVGYTRSAPRRGLTASLYGSYWHRAELHLSSQSGGSTDTGSVSGTIGWVFNRFVSLHGAYSYSTQPHLTITVVEQDGTTKQQPIDSANYGSYGVFLRWAIGGR